MGTLILFLMIHLITNSNSNLICNGDFEGYGLPAPPVDWYIYDFIGSNYSCWYNEVGIGAYFEIQAFWTPWTSTICDLSHDYPYTLCQDVSLDPGALYQLNFSTYNSIWVLSSEISVKINNQVAFKFSTDNAEPFHQASYTFLAIHLMNQICFSSVDVTSRISRSVSLDNITLINLSELSNLLLD